MGVLERRVRVAPATVSLSTKHTLQACASGATWRIAVRSTLAYEQLSATLQPIYTVTPWALARTTTLLLEPRISRQSSS